MIKHIWSVLCQTAAFDIQTNSVSMFNVLENIIVLGVPSNVQPLVIQAELVSLWTREDFEVSAMGQMQVYYADAKGNKSPPINIEINLSQGPFHRTRINIPGLMLTESGKFIFHVEYKNQGDDNWSSAAAIPLLIVSQEMPPIN